MKARYLLLVIVLFAIFPGPLVAACKVVIGALLKITADLAGVDVT